LVHLQTSVAGYGAGKTHHRGVILALTSTWLGLPIPVIRQRSKSGLSAAEMTCGQKNNQFKDSSQAIDLFRQIGFFYHAGIFP
jgi:hypothetical protein